MGNIETRRRRRASSLILDDEDLNTVERQYNAMCAGQSTINKRSFDKFAEKYLESRMRELVFDSIMKLSHTKKITIESFVHFAEETLHSDEQQSKWLISFGQPLRTIVDCLVGSFFVCEEQDFEPSDRDLIVNYLLIKAPPDPASYEGVREWMDKSPVLQMVLNRVFDAFLLGRRKKAIPFLGNHSLLSPAAICVIVNYLPPSCRYQWTPLYSSREHGLSFEKLAKTINRKGACIIVIKTKSGRTFGGYANKGFVVGNPYHGDRSCFLFEDRHTLAIHKATGRDEKFAYLNSRSDAVSKGLGLGGDDKQWSIFIETDCRRGFCSPEAKTFEKCCLAGAQDFEVVAIDVWRIGRDVRVRFDTIGNEIPLEKDEIRLEKEEIPMEKEEIPLEKDEIPLEKEEIPMEKDEKDSIISSQDIEGELTDERKDVNRNEQDEEKSEVFPDEHV